MTATDEWATAIAAEVRKGRGGVSAERVAAVLAEHEYALQLGTRRSSVCVCGFVPDVDPTSLRSQQDYHRAHVAAQIAAALNEPAPTEGASDWPCDNYIEPHTCLSAGASETACCRICRVRAADRIVAALPAPTDPTDDERRDEGLRERVEALAEAEPDCWVFRVPAADGLACTDLIGGRIGSGAGMEFTADQCCLPCRLRAALATQPTAEEG